MPTTWTSRSRVRRPGPAGRPRSRGTPRCRRSRDWPHPGCGPGRRDRRHHPVRIGIEADLLGGSDAQASSVRHPRPSWTAHQAGFASGPLGSDRVGQDVSKNSEVGVLRERVADRRGRNIGSLAAARRQLELGFYALRDGHVRARNICRGSHEHSLRYFPGRRGSREVMTPNIWPGRPS
jgi:hypothetical protein